MQLTFFFFFPKTKQNKTKTQKNNTGSMGENQTGLKVVNNPTAPLPLCPSAPLPLCPLPLSPSVLSTRIISAWSTVACFFGGKGCVAIDSCILILHSSTLQNSFSSSKAFIWLLRVKWLARLSFVYLFETRSHYVTLVVLGLATYTRLVSDHRDWFLSTVIKGKHTTMLANFHLWTWKERVFLL